MSSSSSSSADWNEVEPITIQKTDPFVTGSNLVFKFLEELRNPSTVFSLYLSKQPRIHGFDKFVVSRSSGLGFSPYFSTMAPKRITHTAPSSSESSASEYTPTPMPLRKKLSIKTTRARSKRTIPATPSNPAPPSKPIITPYFPDFGKNNTVQGLMNAWLMAPYRSSTSSSRYPNPPFKTFTRANYDDHTKHNFYDSFPGEASFFTEDFEKDVTRVDHSVNQIPTIQAPPVELSVRSKDAISELRELFDRGPAFLRSYPILYPTKCHLRTALQLLASFSNLFIEVLLKYTAYNNFLWACYVLNASAGISPLIHKQLDHTIKTIPSIVGWLKIHDNRKRRVEEARDEYEDHKLGVDIFLQEYEEVVKGFPYCGADVEARAREEEISKSYEKKATELYKKLRSHDHLALEVEEAKEQLEFEAQYFEHYWQSFHNVVTFGIPHFYEVQM